MQRNLIFLCVLSPVFISVSACSNPANDFYQKPVEQGQKAVDKAKDVQQKVDKKQSTLELQEKALEGVQNNQ